MRNPLGSLGCRISQQKAFWWSLVTKTGKKWNFGGFLGIYCRAICDQIKRHQGLVKVVIGNGCMLALNSTAKNNNLTLYLCQTR